MDAVGVLLGGGLRHSLLRRQVGCAIGTLPINEHGSLLGAWIKRFSSDSRIKKILVVSSDEFDRKQLKSAGSVLQVDCDIEHIVDPSPHRGTGGVLSDVMAKLPWDLMLMGEISAMPPAHVSKTLDSVEYSDAAMSVGVSELDRPIGIFAMLRMALEKVPQVGYFDLKEQLVPALANAGHVVRPVVLMPRHIRLENLDGWLSAIRTMEGGVHPEADVSPAARIEGTVCVLKDAIVKSNASIRDSLIMEGACIESEAVVARSVVGPGMRIKKGHRIIDGILMNTYSDRSHRDGIAPIAIGTGRLRPIRRAHVSDSGQKDVSV